MGNVQNTRDRSELVMACLRTCTTAVNRASIAMSSTCKVETTAACTRFRPRSASRQACTALQKSSVTQQMGSNKMDRPPMQVLFCGEELPFSYKYTAEALQNEHGIKVITLLRDVTRPQPRWTYNLDSLHRLSDARNLRSRHICRRPMWLYH